MFFELSTPVLALVLFVIVAGSATAGIVTGRRLRARPGTEHQSVGVVQGTLLGLVGLLLAFGLTMAVGRYEARRALVVQEANDIGTTYLRAQLLAEPTRTDSLELLQRYADAAVDLADQKPESGGFDAASTEMNDLQRQLWALAGDAVRADPVGTAPRLYVESLNETIDAHTSRVASLGNRVPSMVMLLQVTGSAIALFVLSLYLALLGRGLATALVATLVILLILFISFDLDRPHRGFIEVPDAPLVQARAAMVPPPAADGP
jgi:hypothetical protein